MIKKLFLSVILVLQILSIHASDQSKSKELKAIHNALLNLFLPCDSFSKEHRIIAIHLQKKSWKQIKKSPFYQTLLQPLAHLNNFPNDIVDKFQNNFSHGFAHADSDDQNAFLLALRRHDCTLAKYIAQLRTLYIFMAYNSPLTEELSEVTFASKQVMNTSVELPESKLRINNHEIIHNDGPIDYLIVGSGPAGSLIAHELARLKKNCRIVVIESGSFVIPQSTLTESASELMESQNQRTTVTGGIIVRNGCVVGGGTTVNLDLAFSPLLPCITKNLQSWIDRQLITKELFKQEYTHDWRHLRNIYNWVKEKTHTRLVTNKEINENNRLLQNAAPDTVHTYSLNQKEWTGNPHEILKISAVDAFLLPALQGGNEFQSSINLISDAKANRILFDNHVSKKAVGIELRLQKPLDKTYVVNDFNNFNQEPGTIVTISAKNIIICAGALGTAELLLRSDLNNEFIGKGIVIHPSIGILARFPQEINVMQGLSASVFAHAHDLNDDYFFEAMAADPRFIAAVHPGSGQQILDTVKNFKHLGGFGIMLIDSVDNRNTISLNPVTRAAEIHYQLQEKDKIRLRKALKEGIRMLFDQGAQEVFFPTSEPILSDMLAFVPITDKSQIGRAVDAWQGIENQNFISSAHMQASAKMGSDPAQSVVSPNFKVWNTANGTEIQNLYVMDSSIFPTSVGANPMQSIYTFAKFFVNTLTNDLV